MKILGGVTDFWGESPPKKTGLQETLPTYIHLHVLPVPLHFNVVFWILLIWQNSTLSRTNSNQCGTNQISPRVMIKAAAKHRQTQSWWTTWWSRKRAAWGTLTGVSVVQNASHLKSNEYAVRWSQGLKGYCRLWFNKRSCSHSGSPAFTNQVLATSEFFGKLWNNICLPSIGRVLFMNGQS